MEYVIVEFPDSRDVFVDDADDPVASTNEMFELEEGTHYFNLGQPINYRPATDWAQVMDTIPASPLKIIFRKIT